MKSNNKVNRGETIANLFRKSWALLPYAIRTLTEFLDKIQIFEPKSWIYFFVLSNFFFVKNKENLLVLERRLTNLKQA